jgi:hypothetical protein
MREGEGIRGQTQIIEDNGGRLRRSITITYDAVGNVLTQVAGLGVTVPPNPLLRSMVRW